jgi:beta-1,4-mannosyltransferase
MERPVGSSLVRFAERFEKFMGKNAHAHLTVTKAMAKELKSWNVKGKLLTLYDKAPNHINVLTLKQKMTVTL